MRRSRVRVTQAAPFGSVESIGTVHSKGRVWPARVAGYEEGKYERASDNDGLAGRGAAGAFKPRADRPAGNRASGHHLGDHHLQGYGGTKGGPGAPCGEAR